MLFRFASFYLCYICCHKIHLYIYNNHLPFHRHHQRFHFFHIETCSLNIEISKHFEVIEGQSWHRTSLHWYLIQWRKTNVTPLGLYRCKMAFLEGVAQGKSTAMTLSSFNRHWLDLLGLINANWKSSNSRPWKYFFLALRPLEKSHFKPIKGQGCDIRFPSL